MKSEESIRARAMFITRTKIPLLISSIIIFIGLLILQNNFISIIGAFLIGLWATFAWILPYELEMIVND